MRHAGAGLIRSPRTFERLARLAVTAAAAALALLTVSAPAEAVVDSHCSPTGDYCTGIFRPHGQITFKLATFSFSGPYRLCVNRVGPPERRCHRFHLEHHGGLYTDKVGWKGHFADHSPGRYRVSWYAIGSRLGPALTFRVN
jgi:hypothetical protein